MKEITPEILEELELFETEVERFKRGEVGEDEFKRFRLQQGIYGQRQSGVHMVRVKVPYGRLNSTQLVELARIGEEFADGIAHVTTRQDIQFHWVMLSNVPTVLRRLADVGLTTREAGGNSVRNVTACPLAGVCVKEVFDVTPYAHAVAYHLLRYKLTQSLPRKFKITFSGCGQDCSFSQINDIGSVAAKKVIDGRERLGFITVVGGGLGSSPRLAVSVSDFILAEDIIPFCESVARVFNVEGDRKNRNRARLKFVVQRIGVDELRKKIEAEFEPLRKEWAEKYPDGWTPEPIGGTGILPVTEPVQDVFNQWRESAAAEPEFGAWLDTNVVEQRQRGYGAVYIHLDRGDITSSQLRHLARIADKYVHGDIRTTIQQKIVLRSVKSEHLRELFLELRECGLGELNAGHLGDIVSCPGATTCNLGITSSPGLAKAIKENLGENANLEGIRIRMSGCPNSCGHHHLAQIGLFGGARKINDRLVPHSDMLVGGGVENGKLRLGQSVIKLPVKNVPQAVNHLISLYKKERRDGESFNQYIARTDRGHLREELSQFATVPGFGQARDYYFDWGSNSPFSLEDRGVGECAGALVDTVEEYFQTSDQSLFRAKLALEKSDFSDAYDKACRALADAARALLVTIGVDPSDDAELVREFRDNIIDVGSVPERFLPLVEKLLTQPETVSEADGGTGIPACDWLHDYYNEVKDFANACKQVYEKASGATAQPHAKTGGTGIPACDWSHAQASDQSVAQASLPVIGQISESSPATTESKEKMDLRGVKCPLNFVKTKLKLETMNKGEILEVWLDEGEPIRSVPRSVKDEGHEILETTRTANHYRVVIKKS